MFAPAGWEQDVPENAAHFPRIHKGKKSVNADKAAVEPIYVSTKDKKNKHNKKKNAENLHKMIVLKNPETSKMAAKRTHSASEVKQNVDEDGNHNGPPRRKRNKSAPRNLLQHNLLEKLDETIIANKKKEMFKTVKPNEVEDMLFSNKRKERSKKTPNEVKDMLYSNNGKERSKKTPKKKEMFKTVKPNEGEDMSFSNNRKEKIKNKPNEVKDILFSNNSKERSKKNLNEVNDMLFSNKRKERSKKTPNEVKDMLYSNNGKERSKKTLKKKVMFKTVKPNEGEDMSFSNNRKEKIKNKPNEVKDILFSNNSKERSKKNLNEANDTLFRNNRKESKEKIRNLLQTHLRTPIKASGASLRQRMTEKLRAAQFRYLNEQLYVSEGKDAKELFKSDPTSFKIYHDGFRQQVKKWPINPLDVIIKQISMMPKNTKIADMGCGEGTLAKRVPQKVRSFDLVSAAEGVEECDMAHTPLLAGEMDVAVYCLALMGTNLKEYLIEANRILKVGGIMKIAEVESRFKDVNDFIKSVECYGFKLTQVDNSHNVFFFITFEKLRNLGSKRNKLPYITLEPCMYKKR